LGMRENLLITVASVACLAAGAASAQAAERVTLRNGFAMDCDHHAKAESRVRLYLTAGEDNYIEFAPQEIAAVESLPDPPPAAKEKPSATVPSPGSNAHLNPADLAEMLAKSTTWTLTCWPALSKPRALAMPAPSAVPEPAD